MESPSRCMLAAPQRICFTGAEMEDYCIHGKYTHFFSRSKFHHVAWFLVDFFTISTFIFGIGAG